MIQVKGQCFQISSQGEKDYKGEGEGGKEVWDHQGGQKGWMTLCCSGGKQKGSSKGKSRKKE